MSAAVIQGEGLGKRYRRGMTVDAGLRHALERFVKSPLSALRKKEETFWALKDVSLQVKESEVLGLIGRNGAGKTTLLKILSRITKPTTGWAEIRGRVGSLLEVGTGFHPELTGRENTFLSGAILGMKKQEIERKFDEIVAFAELEKFIDTPVKHYSSGMYVRLAFAVAAHLEPEILLVDEVLAVGDINFQKKCLGKMGDVARAGRTVVLVSHQLNQIRRLCHRVIWVDAGSVRLDGSRTKSSPRMNPQWPPGTARRALHAARHAKAQFLRWEIAEPREEQAHVLSTLGPVTVNFVVELSQPVTNGEHGVALFQRRAPIDVGARRAEISCSSPASTSSLTLSRRFRCVLAPTSGKSTLWDNGEMLDHWDCVPDMTIATEIHQHYMDEWNGILNLPAEFASRRKRPDD